VRLFRSTDGRFSAQVDAGGRRDIYPLKSAALRDWLVDGYLREFREVPSDWSLRRILGALEATARFESGTHSVFVRVGHDGTGPIDAKSRSSARYFVDLADPAGRAVEIGPQGWAVVNDPGVSFRRPEGSLPLPEPSRDGSIDLLRPYVNISDPDFRLLIVWMAAALRPVGPYPILALHGEQGSAKSTLARIVRLLVDPHAAPLRNQPTKISGLVASAVNNWILAYDNISVLPDWMSDALCMLSTAGSFQCHASPSGDEVVLHIQRPVLLTGIDEFAGRGDLGDRSIVLELPSVTPRIRRCEDELWNSFSHDYPRIFGGLLDAVVGGLRQLSSVRLADLPRMADFAAFAEAVGRGLGWPEGTVLSDHRDNRQQATVLELEDSPLGRVLLEQARYMYDWAGTATDLLDKLTAIAGKRTAASPRWPKSPVWLVRELRRISAQLRVHDISVDFDRNGDRRLILVSAPEPPEKIPSPHASFAGITNCVSKALPEKNLPSQANSNPPNELDAVTVFRP
jgi:hypothetical protein